MKISFSSKGNFQKMETFLERMARREVFRQLASYAKEGVDALASATPVGSGLTAASWTYEIKETRGTYKIIWRNTNLEGGFPVAIMLQYGHATGTGGWVQGQDYINPTIKPVFDKIADKAWKAVISA